MGLLTSEQIDHVPTSSNEFLPMKCTPHTHRPDTSRERIACLRPESDLRHLTILTSSHPSHRKSLGGEQSWAFGSVDQLPALDLEVSEPKANRLDLSRLLSSDTSRWTRTSCGHHQQNTSRWTRAGDMTRGTPGRGGKERNRLTSRSLVTWIAGVWFLVVLGGCNQEGDV